MSPSSGYLSSYEGSRSLRNIAIFQGDRTTLYKSILIIPNPCENIKYHVTSVLFNDAVSTQEVTENKSEAAVVLTDH